jgi:hypothetical protein
MDNNLENNNVVQNNVEQPVQPVVPEAKIVQPVTEPVPVDPTQPVVEQPILQPAPAKKGFNKLIIPIILLIVIALGVLGYIFIPDLLMSSDVDSKKFTSTFESLGYKVTDSTEINKQYKKYGKTLTADKDIKDQYGFNSEINASYTEFKNKSDVNTTFKLYCEIGKDKHLQYKEGLMCEWDRSTGMENGFLFELGKTIVMVKFEDNENRDEAITAIDKLGLSKYLQK